MTQTQNTAVSDPVTELQKAVLLRRHGYSDEQINALETRTEARGELDRLDKGGYGVSGEPMPVHGRRGKA